MDIWVAVSQAMIAFCIFIEFFLSEIIVVLIETQIVNMNIILLFSVSIIQSSFWTEFLILDWEIWDVSDTFILTKEIHQANKAKTTLKIINCYSKFYPSFPLTVN